MQEILDPARLRTVPQPLADEILDRLDVVIGLRLDRLDAFGIVETEIVDDVIEDVFHDGRQRGQIVDLRFVGQPLEPADFDEHAVGEQAEFAEDVSEALDLVGIAPVGR